MAYFRKIAISGRVLSIAALVAIIPLTGMAIAHATSAKPDTRIDVDQRTGTIRFIVKGEDAGFFDQRGLHVRNSIERGGSEISTSSDSYGK